MSWFGGNPWATLAIAGPIPALYQVQQKAQKDQADALRSARDADARMAAEAETGAAVAANAQIADAKRRRRASALGLGDDGVADGLGAPASALSGGASAASRSLAAYYGGASSGSYGSALGIGSPAVTAGPAVRGGSGGGYSRTSSNLR